MVSEDEWLPAVIRLFKGKARCQLVAFAITQADPEQWYRTGQLADHIGFSNEQTRKTLQALTAFGVFERHEEHPKYRVAATEVVELLAAWDGYPLWELFLYSGRRKLSDFFLTQAEDDESYSKNALSEKAGMNYKTVMDHIDALIEAGMVEEVEGNRGTEYKIDPESEIVEYCYLLNEYLAEQYKENMAEMGA